VIFLTLAYSGLRVGELCTLKWRDLSLKERTLSITKTYYNPKNKETEYQLLTPKTLKQLHQGEQLSLIQRVRET
jgi:integrase